ncbi:hypothetical protein WUBG_11388 [Wuchereria bancrofti]|uniref:Uncharacterized protein n=1 Tax=Wuchereria bancrofti TaxID=6293 RepID=J9ATD6_WUCBA|nr:hypothetical protein WUBG_11388 [Wuchereria bancrofti]
MTMDETVAFCPIDTLLKLFSEDDSLQMDTTTLTLRALEKLKDLYCDIAQVPIPQSARLRRQGKYFEVCLSFLYIRFY